MSKVHDIQRRWLADEIAKKGWGAKSALAAHLGVRNDAISRILTEKGDQSHRRISVDELVKMAQFFGSTPPGLAALSNRIKIWRKRASAKSPSQTNLN